MVTFGDVVTFGYMVTFEDMVSGDIRIGFGDGLRRFGKYSKIW